MCFSATASFTAATFVMTAGLFTLSRATRMRDLPLAGVPLLFGVQQAIEGALWLALPHPADAGLILLFANGFALIALVVWPLYSPVAAALAEDDARRRALIWWLLPFGAAFALYSGLDIARHPYHAVLAAHSLCYINDSPYPTFALGPYVLATCGGFLLSTHRALRLFGMIVTAGLGVSLAFFLADLVSTWCFFAAAASVALSFHFHQRVRVPA
ncbi:MAG TPA: DUF6629 family protein [Rhizomicrobium sp.]|nr:DUF6629 family protein [Rhizomicrobium sp.]